MICSMTGSNRTSAELSPRRRRILFRAWHRGIREMDLVFGQFADEQDQDLMRWVIGAEPVPDQFNTALFAKIASYRPDFDPVTMETLGKTS
jgi:antitoxin CptB